ncbi:F-BOX PROTEIN WITH A DOMAIN PROTEIN [Salix purpurea]|uniref:F-BOX PROTEIN WITH A DOMAIN PROTEIN n=1 Tax=Salix purpurea TaxID=77065 RepID=A0A9Q0WMR3_SALPP|nr:F-BOX PROTEIN WITH A DOMAIN PROTEIN [Salix purpurea]
MNFEAEKYSNGVNGSGQQPLANDLHCWCLYIPSIIFLHFPSSTSLHTYKLIKETKKSKKFLYSMTSLQASSFLFSSTCSCSTRTHAAITVAKLPRIPFSAPKIPLKPVEDLNLRDGFKGKIPLENNDPANSTGLDQYEAPIISTTSTTATAKLYAILEAVGDRVEMHRNIGEQRDNWNKLLMSSINMITLTAATMAGVAAGGAAGAPLLALKLSSTLLFSAATGMSIIMNKMQPSQLAEEQRNATRLFKQLYSQIKNTLAVHDPTDTDVEDAMDRVLALDEAYPLPLLGKMIEKFPEKFEPAVWWPQANKSHSREHVKAEGKNGWSEDVEEEMRAVIEVIKRKDSEDYMRLGNLALKVNKILAVSGPLLTAIAAAGSAFVGHGSWAAIVAVTAGALASTVNTFEHGGQVGMVVEMYRNGAGFCILLEESIESTIQERRFGGKG